MAGKDLTEMLGALEPGDRRAADRLLDAVYDKLRALAESKLRGESRGHTLQATALVHEAYLKLVDQTRVDWRGRTHFYAVAAQAMRRVLVDHARSKGRRKRGGAWQRVAMDDAHVLSDDPQLDIVAFNDAMQRMRELDPRQADVIEMRLLGGLTAAESAHLLGVSERTVERDGKMGIAWLRRELSKGD